MKSPEAGANHTCQSLSHSMRTCMHNIQDTLPTLNEVCSVLSTSLDMHLGG